MCKQQPKFQEEKHFSPLFTIRSFLFQRLALCPQEHVAPKNDSSIGWSTPQCHRDWSKAPSLGGVEARAAFNLDQVLSLLLILPDKEAAGVCFSLNLFQCFFAPKDHVFFYLGGKESNLRIKPIK